MLSLQDARPKRDLAHFWTLTTFGHLRNIWNFSIAIMDLIGPLQQ